MSLVRAWASERRATLGLAGLAVVAALALTLFLTAAPGTYEVRAVFANGQGLFAGAPVRLLGVRVGTVTDVAASGGSVEVTMQLAGAQALPRDVQAQLVAPLLLGSPQIELSPGYVGGATLPAGSTIPESRTSVPVTTDQLLRQMQRVLGAVRPASANALVANLARDLSGEGSRVNSLIATASGTLQLLAAKGNDLGRMSGSLAQLTSTLDQHESQLLSLIQAYDTVSTVVAEHQADLGSAIVELDTMSRQLAGLLSPNLKPLEQDVGVVTTAGRTLDRNLGNLDQVMSSSRALFAGAHRAFDPRHDWLNLNNQLAPGLTTNLLEGMIRDRLAGICRRILAHHSSGLSASAKATLATCGNPASGYFDPILGVIPKLLSGAPLGSQPSLPSLVAPGLSKIPGLSSAQRRAVSRAAGAAGATTTTTTTRPASSAHHNRQKKKCKPGLDGAIDCVLGPIGSSGSSGSSGAGLSGLSGLFGLLGLIPVRLAW